MTPHGRQSNPSSHTRTAMWTPWGHMTPRDPARRPADTQDRKRRDVASKLKHRRDVKEIEPQLT